VLYLAGAALLLGLLLLWWSARTRQKAGLPAGRVVYSDTGLQRQLEKPLYDRALGLTGRPDYLIERDDEIIPVEVKSSPAPREPYDSHVLQLAAYCLLVERQLGKRVPYGLLRYNDRTIPIDFTPQLQETLLETLAEMRRLERGRGLPARSHQSPARCRRCGFREICDQRLNA